MQRATIRTAVGLEPPATPREAVSPPGRRRAQTCSRSRRGSAAPLTLVLRRWRRSAAGRRRRGRGGAPGLRAALGRPREAERPRLGRSCAPRAPATAPRRRPQSQPARSKGACSSTKSRFASEQHTCSEAHVLRSRASRWRTSVSITSTSCRQLRRKVPTHRPSTSGHASAPISEDLPQNRFQRSRSSYASRVSHDQLAAARHAGGRRRHREALIVEIRKHKGVRIPTVPSLLVELSPRFLSRPPSSSACSSLVYAFFSRLRRCTTHSTIRVYRCYCCQALAAALLWQRLVRTGLGSAVPVHG